MKKQNIRIAKELVRIAKEITSSQKIGSFNYENNLYKELFVQMLTKIHSYRKTILQSLINLCIKENKTKELQDLLSSNLLKESESQMIVDKLIGESDNFENIYEKYDKIDDIPPRDMIEDSHHRPNLKHDKFQHNKKTIDKNRRKQRNYKNNQYYDENNE